MPLFDFELSSWMFMQTEVDSDSDDLSNSSEGLDDWLFNIADNAEVSLKYGHLDDDLDVVQPEIIYYSSSTGEPFDIEDEDSVDELAEDLNTTVKPIGYSSLLGATNLSFRYGIEVRVSVEAPNLDEAKEMVKTSVASSFYFSTMDENQDIDYLKVTCVSDNSRVFESDWLPEGCSGCQYKIKRGAETCSNCGGTTFEKFS